MKPTCTSTTLGVGLIAVAFAAPPVWAGGIALYEIGTADVGLASAGYAARAQDASTLFKNPAGMSQLGTPQLQAGLQLLYGDVEFNKDSDGTGPLLRDDSSGGNAIGALPGLSLFYVHPLSEKAAVGFGSLSYFGLAEDFGDDWVGRYYVQKGSLLGMSLMPAASYKVTDWLSIGAGFNAMFGYLDTEVAVRQLTSSDGQMKVKDNTWGFGANAGVLIEPVKGTRIGLTYLSPVDLNFKDKPGFKGLNPAGLGALPLLRNPPKLNLGVTVPQMVMAGVYHELNEKWAIMADVGWQNWKALGKVDVQVDSADAAGLTTKLDYKDTWHGAAGVQFKPNGRWQFSGGLAYDSSAVSDSNRTLSLPMGEAYRFGLGAIYRWKENVDLGFGYEFMWLGDMPVVQESVYRGRVSGSFDNSWFSFLSGNVTWRF
ncbi:MAG TPA: outer membrane protein transport protein [Verrucomicrobiota bacterium]|nr:outer membrane protein transport protein [Verrucomicrobiota bacterium]HRZ37206.1 outer membrane protein transport protein [Candidatus Paceibacterota bacterium]HRZ55786.1 outer membrane protein transport protein [Candidatus Paceibacterota bacterium]